MKWSLVAGTLLACLQCAGAHACPPPPAARDAAGRMVLASAPQSRYQFVAEVVGEEIATVESPAYPAEAGRKLTALRLRVTESRHPEVPVGSERVMYRAGIAADCSPRAADLTLWHFRQGSIVVVDTDDLASTKPSSELRRLP